MHVSWSQNGFSSNPRRCLYTGDCHDNNHIIELQWVSVSLNIWHHMPSTSHGYREWWTHGDHITELQRVSVSTNMALYDQYILWSSHVYLYVVFLLQWKVCLYLFQVVRWSVIICELYFDSLTACFKNIFRVSPSQLCMIELSISPRSLMGPSRPRSYLSHL